jgi:hypothetical protein
MIPRLALLIVLLVARAGADPLATLPPRYMAVGWFGATDAPMFAFWRTMPGGPPPCVDTVLAKADGYLQAQLPKVKASLLVFRGKLDRAAVEQCVRDVLAKIAMPNVKVTPQGALTKVEANSTTFYLGWASDGSVIEAREQADVEEVLAHKSKPNADLMAMVARADRTKSTWFAGALDYTTPLLGVASMGYFASFDLTVAKATKQLRVPVTLVFPNPADAKRAAQAIAAAAHDKRFSAALQVQLGRLGPTTKGADLAIDLAPLAEKPELLGEMTKLVTDLPH